MRCLKGVDNAPSPLSSRLTAKANSKLKCNKSVANVSLATETRQARISAAPSTVLKSSADAPGAPLQG
jgi:hypothetical protein